MMISIPDSVLQQEAKYEWKATTGIAKAAIPAFSPGRAARPAIRPHQTRVAVAQAMFADGYRVDAQCPHSIYARWLDCVTATSARSPNCHAFFIRPSAMPWSSVMMLVPGRDAVHLLAASSSLKKWMKWQNAETMSLRVDSRSGRSIDSTVEAGWSAQPNLAKLRVLSRLLFAHTRKSLAWTDAAGPGGRGSPRRTRHSSCVR